VTQFTLAEKELVEAIGLWIRARMGDDVEGAFTIKFEIDRDAEAGLRVVAVATSCDLEEEEAHGTVDSG